MTEIRSNFNGVKTALNLATGGYSVSGDASKWIIYEKRWIKLFHDNFFPADSRVLWVIASVFLLFWIYQALKKVEYRLLLTWIFGGVAIFIFGAYSAYYINVGIGTGLIIGLAAFADKAIDQSKYVGFAVILLALAGNIYQIRALNKDGLIEDIKTQQFMFLADEIKIINKMYSLADNKSFTMRITSMPYNMQTVWAYLIDQYGKPVHGYSPYYETGNVLGFPGYIPQPTSGVTCVRFLIREPIGGIPKHLIEKDEKDEDEFSKIEDTFEFGYFLLEKRISLDSRCLTENFPK